MRLEASITVHVDADTARATEQALAPETADPVPGTSVEVTAGEEGLALAVAADDVASMRAALNSMLRFTDTALEVQSKTEETR